MKKRPLLLLTTMLVLAGCAGGSADTKEGANSSENVSVSNEKVKEETKKEGLIVKKTAYLSKIKEEVVAALPMIQLVEDAGDFSGVYKGTFNTTISSLGSNREDDGVLEVHKDGSFTLYRLELKDGGGIWSDMDIWTGYLSQEFGEYGLVFVDKGTFTPETTTDKQLVFDSIKNPVLGLDVGEPVLDDDLLFVPKDGTVTIRSKGNNDTKIWLYLEKADGKELAVAIGWPELKSAYQVQDEIKLHAGNLTEMAEKEKAGMSEEERLLADIQGFWYDTGTNRYITITEDHFQTVSPIAQGVVESFITEKKMMKEYRVELVDTGTNTVQLLIKNPIMDVADANTAYVTMQFDGESRETALGLAGPSLITPAERGSFFNKWIKVADKDHITVEAFQSFQNLKSEKAAISSHEPVIDLPLDSPFFDFTDRGLNESSYFTGSMKNSLESLGHVIENGPDKASLFITNPAFTTAAKLIANGEATPDDEMIWEQVVNMISENYRIRNAGGAQELDVYIADGYPNFSRVLWFKGDMRDLLTADNLRQKPMTEKEMADALFGYWADTEQDYAYYISNTDYSRGSYGEYFSWEPTLEEVTEKIVAWQEREALPNHQITYFPKSGVVQFWANYSIHRIDLASGSNSHLVGIYSNVLGFFDRDFQVTSWSRVAEPDGTPEEIAEVIKDVMLDNITTY